MKIAIFCTQDVGGAGRAALRLNKGLKLAGQDSTMFVKFKSTRDSKVETVRGSEIHNSLFETINQNYFNKNIYPGNTMMSILYPSIGFNFLEAFHEYDIINIHWVSSFLSIEAMIKMRAMGKPIIWTLHDQNAMTGGCHYTHGCDKYLSNCSSCPQRPVNEDDITRIILGSKQKNIPKDVIIVTPSNWLAECARKSTIFKRHRIEVIKNSVETEIFSPIQMSQARRRLNLPEKAKIILFGAEDHKEKRKGFQQLLEAVLFLKSMERIQNQVGLNNLFLLSFGNPSEEIKKLGLPYKSLGYTKDDTMLAAAYSASDVLALPSLEDNLPNVMLECLSCGTPVIAFKTGGMSDAIYEGVTGYTVPLLNAPAFAERLADVLLGESMRTSCRNIAETEFQLSVQAKAYLELFNELANTNFIPLSLQTPVVFPEVAQALMPYIVDLSIGMQERVDAPVRTFKNDINELFRRLHDVQFLRKIISFYFLWNIFKIMIKHLLPYGIVKYYQKKL